MRDNAWSLDASVRDGLAHVYQCEMRGVSVRERLAHVYLCEMRGHSAWGGERERASGTRISVRDNAWSLSVSVRERLARVYQCECMERDRLAHVCQCEMGGSAT